MSRKALCYPSAEMVPHLRIDNFRFTTTRRRACRTGRQYVWKRNFTTGERRSDELQISLRCPVSGVLPVLNRLGHRQTDTLTKHDITLSELRAYKPMQNNMNQTIIVSGSPDHLVVFNARNNSSLAEGDNRFLGD